MSTISVDRQQLLAQLDKAAIPMHLWGQGKAKTLDDLIAEITDGETVLTGDGDTFRRNLSVLTVHVYCVREGKRWQLYEDRQEFDGRPEPKRRGYSWLSEKLKHGEEPGQAVSRAIKEELGIDGPFTSVVLNGSRQDERQPDSYPGLRSCYMIHDFTVEIRPDDFRAEGYVEKQSGKTTYFLWREIPSS
jgi:hypothetical protein